MIDPKSYQEAEERLKSFDKALQTFLQKHPRTDPMWDTPAPYNKMLAATQLYAEAAIKDSIWAYAQTFVDIASTGAFGKADTTHQAVPSEFQTLFDNAIEAVQSTTGNPDEQVEEIYLKLNEIMWDAITNGFLLRISIGWSSAVARAHLFANDTILRQAAETVYEVKRAAQRLGPITVSLGAWQTAGGNPPAPEIVQGLAFYTERDGVERPPVWAEIHMAIISTPILADISRRTGERFRESFKEAAGADLAEDYIQGLNDLMEALGGVVGLLTIAAAVAGGVFLYRTFSKG